MRKVIAIIILGLLWCNVGFALTQQSAIDQYLSDRKLERIEGIWVFQPGGRIIVIYKSNNSYYNKVIFSRDLTSGSTNTFNFQKGSSTYFYGDNTCPYGPPNNPYKFSTTCAEQFYITGINTIQWSNQYPPGTNVQPSSQTNPLVRIWPTDIVAHNAKFKTKKDIADEEKVVADMVADAKKTCKVLGFKEESEKFADCTLKLYTQKVDELVAEKKAKALMTQSQTTTTTQSSGSNVTTIYDPVRDSKALMQQGQKMLSGRCTLGVDC